MYCIVVSCFVVIVWCVDFGVIICSVVHMFVLISVDFVFLDVCVASVVVSSFVFVLLDVLS